MAVQETTKKLVKRADKVAYMNVGGQYLRMEGFTSLSTNKNPKEYTRQYVDEIFETTDVVGLSTSIDFGFDQFIGDKVHEALVKIIDNEIIGTDAVVEICVVDYTKPVDGLEENGGFEARSRKYAVIPNTEGGSLDAYTYEGTFRVNGNTVKGTATVKDSSAKTIQFKAEEV